MVNALYEGLVKDKGHEGDKADDHEARCHGQHLGALVEDSDDGAGEEHAHGA